MKYILTAKDDHRIMHISDDLGYQSNGNYLIYGGELAVPPILADMAEVETVPDGVEPEKWCYAEGEFAENPNYVEPTEPDDPAVAEALNILKGGNGNDQ